MQLERLENLNHPMYDKAMELYKISFPVHEQREKDSQEELLKEKGKAVILEIDQPIDEQSMRRKGFYERCEFVENSYVHIHPPYHRGNQVHELILMTFPKEISEGMYESFREYLEYRIMENAFV